MAAATAQANLNRIDQFTPQGSIRYEQRGTNEDGTPRYAQIQEYSPGEQANYEAGNQVSQGLSNLAVQNIGRVRDTQAGPFNFNSMTPQVSSVGANLPAMNYGPAYTAPAPQPRPEVLYPPTAGKGAPEVAYGAPAGGKGSTEPRPEVLYGPDGPPASSGGGSPPPVLPALPTGPGGVGEQGRAKSMPFGMMGYASTMTPGMEGRAQALQPGSQGRATAMDLSSLGQAAALTPTGEQAAALTPTGEQAAAMPFGVSGGPQRQLDYRGLTSLPGANDFGAEARRVSDSVYGQYASRLDPQFAQQQNDLSARLAAQGISNNSDAYRREMDNAGRTRNDAYAQAAFQAQQAGGAEQSRLFGLAMGARQQGQNEANTLGTFANQAQNQDFGQQAQTFDQRNAAQQQNFGQAYQTAEQRNAAQNQNFGQAYQTAEQRNAAQNQNFGQAYQATEQSNAAQNQNFGQAYQTAEQGNAAQNQNFGQTRQTYEQQNAAQGQNYGQFLQNYNQVNAAQGQNYDQAMGIADYLQNAQSQAFNQNLSAAGFQNQARSQAFNEQSSNAALTNAARQQQISEASYLRNLPLNEIAALMGTAGGVQDPNFQPVSQVGVAAPDYQGMVQNNFNAANTRYQQQQASRSQMLGSVASLAGNAASMFMMSDRRLKYDIRRVGSLANGLKTYAFKYIGSKVQQFGVMAQDVLTVRPDAVGVAPNGYLFVDYAKVL